MADLTIQSSKRLENNDITMSAATATTGDKWVNTGRECLFIRNASGSPITVTVQTPITSDGLSVTDRTRTVAAGAFAWLGPFQRSVYSNSSDSNKATVICSSVTSVTLAVLKVGS